MTRDEARIELNNALFRNVYNMFYNDNKYEITFEGDNYVVWDKDEDALYHFRVFIKNYEWNSIQARKDQEWDI